MVVAMFFEMKKQHAVESKENKNGTISFIKEISTNKGMLWGKKSNTLPITIVAAMTIVKYVLGLSIILI